MGQIWTWAAVASGLRHAEGDKAPPATRPHPCRVVALSLEVQAGIKTSKTGGGQGSGPTSNSHTAKVVIHQAPPAATVLWVRGLAMRVVEKMGTHGLGIHMVWVYSTLRLNQQS